MTREDAIQYLTDTGISSEHIMELVEALSNSEEPCDDCISRQAAIDACLNGWNKDYKEIVEEIRALPPVNPAEKVGQWIYEGYYKCSECGKTTYSHKTNYCPNCGAKMGGDAE